MSKRIWWIVGRKRGVGGAWYPVETSRGYPYAELRTIARKMGHNGEGMVYMVQEATR